MRWYRRRRGPPASPSRRTSARQDDYPELTIRDCILRYPATPRRIGCRASSQINQLRMARAASVPIRHRSPREPARARAPLCGRRRLISTEITVFLPFADLAGFPSAQLHRGITFSRDTRTGTCKKAHLSPTLGESWFGKVCELTVA